MLGVILFSSCVTQKKCLEKYPNPPPSIEKVVETVTVFKDTIIYVYLAADTVYMTDTVIVDKEGRVNYPLARLDTEYAWSTLEIKNSMVFHYLYQKESKIAQTIENAIKESTTSEVTVIKEPYPVPTPISWWNQTLIKGGYAFLLLCLAGIIWFLIKFKKPF